MQPDNYEKNMQLDWPCNGEQGAPQSIFAVNVMRIAKMIRNKAEPIMLKHELTMMEFEILIVLRNFFPEAKRPSEIYKEILVSSGGTTKAIKSLEGREFIVTQSDPNDGRSRLIELTSTGKKLVEELKAELVESDRQMFSQVMTDEEMNDMGQALLGIVQGLSDH